MSEAQRIGDSRSSPFQALAEDMLICIISCLEPPDILRLGQTCKSLQQLTMLRIVWTNACFRHVMACGYPFSSTPIDEMSTLELMRAVKRAYSLARRWISGIKSPYTIRFLERTSGTSVSDVRFVPGKENRLLVTMSKTVWSIMSVWDIGPEQGSSVTSSKVCEWSPRGAIFTGFAINSDSQSLATMAISLQLNEQHCVKILSLHWDSQSSSYSVDDIFSINTTMKPKTLSGNLLALTDDNTRTAIWDWRNGVSALLEHLIDDRSGMQSNDCNQVFFAHQSILVARARSIHLFPFPDLKPIGPYGISQPAHRPIAKHSFGWVDGQSLIICPFLKATTHTENTANLSACQPLSILVRGESDDPWASDIHNLELYTLDPNPIYGRFHTSDDDSTIPPYLFPPRLSSKVACLRGSLRCKQVMLGRFGTAMWIQPRDRFIGGLLADIPSHFIPASNSHETVVMTAFPGSLNIDRCEEAADGDVSIVIGKNVFGNESTNSWTSFDYDEVGGRVALGSNFGRVTILEL